MTTIMDTGDMLILDESGHTGQGPTQPGKRGTTPAPRRLAQIVGQSHATDTLLAGMQSDRLHHAYIFHGPSGVGKFTTARLFGKLLLCPQPEIDLAGRAEPCNQCESCLLIDTNDHNADAHGDNDKDSNSDNENNNALTSAHPDFHVIVKELAQFSDDRSTRERKLLSIPVDVLRDALLEPVYRAARMGPRKVFIVDEAELLNPTGQNLLLKTLEEPPPGTFLVLVTSHEDRLLPTIRSRCQRVGFAPLPDDAVRMHIEKIAPDTSPAQRDWLSRFADGSMGRASLAVQHDLYKWAQSIEPMLADIERGRLPYEMGSTMAQHIDEFAKSWVDAHKGASKEAANKQAAALMFHMLALHARQKLAAIAAQCDPNDPVTADARVARWLGMIDAISQTEHMLMTNVNLSLACDFLAAKIHASTTAVH